ncbi:MAG: hypothetical protein C5B46_08610 [Proteobacteria bacterium]|nr:MAG: hypothetical protein C5B46_08610 [Pseudomonadota bacterium]
MRAFLRIALPRAVAAFIVVLAALIAGCGFRPSGYVSLPFHSVYISAPAYSSFGGELKRYIASGSRATLATRREDADVTLEVMSELEEAQILSISVAGRVAEYRLQYRLTYRLRDNRNRDWIPQSEILLHRDFTYDDQAVLAKENEQSLLFQDMRSDAVRQMIRRLSAAREPSPTPAG